MRMVGHFAVTNTWTEIDSLWEGNFLERIAPGAFARTFREDTIRSLFQHGRDPELGDKLLGLVEVVREDATGAYYEVPLLPSVPALVVDGLRAGLYGSSFRFRVDAEELVNDPKPSAYNPAGIPERTITAATVYEFGPVTFPQYDGATAGLRAWTPGARRARLLEVLG